MVKALSVLFLMLTTSPIFMIPGFLQNVVVGDEIKKAFTNGNAKQLSTFFCDVVNMNFEEVESICSRYQAESILLDFFEKNPPKTFEIEQEGITSEGSRFVIATYSTIYGCKYRVFYASRKKSQFSKKEERIYQLSINKNKQCQSKK